MEQKTEAPQAVTIEFALRQIIEADDNHALTQQLINIGRAALKAQPAPTEAMPKLVIALPDYERRRLIIASDEMIDGERVVCAALKSAPTEAAQVTVTVERGGVYITKGVQSFRLAYEGETQAEKEWYAGQLREALGQGKDSAGLDEVVEANRALLHERSQLGIKKYGGTLGEKRYPHRELLTHALLEALDLSNYLQAAIMGIDRASAETGGVKP